MVSSSRLPHGRRGLDGFFRAVALQAVACSFAFGSPAIGAPVVAETSPTKVFVLDLQAVGVDDAMSSQLTAIVAAELAARPRFTVLTRADVLAVVDLEKSQNAIGCADDATCLARITEGIGADLVVTGTVGKVGTEVTLSLTLVDTTTATVKERASGPVMQSQSAADVVNQLDLNQAVRTILDELFGTAVEKGVRFQLEPGAALSFAVFDLESAGVSDDVARSLTQVLSSEVKRIDGATVIGRDDIAALLELEAQKEFLGCSESASCMAEIGDALGVARLISGQVGKVATSYVITLRLISTERAVVENRVSETFQGSEEQLLPAVRHAARRLLGLSANDSGTLVVTSQSEGATVLVDGVSRGVTPLAPLKDLTPGRHELRVMKDHHFDYRSDVYIGPGDTVSQWVVLERTPDEWYENGFLWTGLGGIGVVALAIGAATVAGIGAYLWWEENRTHPLEVSASVPVRQ
jgi:TolB-like protein